MQEVRMRFGSPPVHPLLFAFFTGIGLLLPVGAYFLMKSPLYSLGLLCFVIFALVAWRHQMRSLPNELVVNRANGTFFFVSPSARQESRPLSDLKQVTLVRTVMTSSERGRGRTVYPVLLQYRDDSKSPLLQAETYLGARGSAERLARMLQVDLRDEALSEPVTRDHRTLDALWVDRASRTQESPGPARGRLTLLSQGPPLQVELPRERAGTILTTLLAMGVALAIVVGILTLLIPPLREPVDLGWARPPVYLVLAAGLVLFSLPTLAGRLIERFQASLGKTLEAGPTGMSVAYRCFGLRWRQHFDLGKVEEVRLDASGLTVLDDHRIQRVHCPLTPEESAWLQAALAQAVSRV